MNIERVAKKGLLLKDIVLGNFFEVLGGTIYLRINALHIHEGDNKTRIPVLNCTSAMIEYLNENHVVFFLNARLLVED